MVQIVEKRNLLSRRARKKLPVSHDPHWQQVRRGLYLGYRKGAKGGVWYGRVYQRDYGSYKKWVLGYADDFSDEDEALDHTKAVEELLKKGTEIRRTGPSYSPNATVQDCMYRYLDHLRVSGKSISRNESAIKKHILPKLGKTKLEDLTTARLNNWLNSLVDDKGVDSETARRRRSTANRTFTILRAALNLAYREGSINSDTAWKRVKPFKGVEQPRVRYLTPEQITKLVSACREDFGKLVLGAIHTGCRYGEITSVQKKSFDPRVGKLTVFGKNQTYRTIPLTDEGRDLFVSLCRNKKDDDYIFVRNDGKRWGPDQQTKLIVSACEKAGIEPAISFHILRHTYGSLLALKDVPLQIIAKLMGHKDTRMTERHYAHLSESHVDATLRKSFPNFGVNG